MLIPEFIFLFHPYLLLLLYYYYYYYYYNGYLDITTYSLPVIDK